MLIWQANALPPLPGARMTFIANPALPCWATAVSPAMRAGIVPTSMARCRTFRQAQGRFCGSLENSMMATPARVPGYRLYPPCGSRTEKLGDLLGIHSSGDASLRPRDIFHRKFGS
jgi:hypothetical protein